MFSVYIYFYDRTNMSKKLYNQFQSDNQAESEEYMKTYHLSDNLPRIGFYFYAIYLCHMPVFKFLYIEKRNIPD